MQHQEFQAQTQLSREKQKVAVFGAGYVGLVSAAAMVMYGHEVMLCDIDVSKIEGLKQGRAPFFEPQLEDLLSMIAIEKKPLFFTSQSQEALQFAQTIVIAVGTPCDEQGFCDLSAVDSVLDAIVKHKSAASHVVIKSTVSIGKSRKISQNLAPMGKVVIHCPEFLREGFALQDTLNPARIVLGFQNQVVESHLVDFVLALFKNPNHTIPILVMDYESSEFSKYASNIALASRISLVNELSRCAEFLGADILKVESAMGADPRIGPQFLKAGLGYGGSCFPKDLLAFLSQVQRKGQGQGQNLDHNPLLELNLLPSIGQANNKQIEYFFEKMRTSIGDLRGQVVSVWGLTFKPNTDDMRFSPSIAFIKKCLEHGAQVQVYDPTVKQLPEMDLVKVCLSPLEALSHSKILVIATAWNEFNQCLMDMDDALHLVEVFDARNIFAQHEDLWIPKVKKYHAIGRSKWI